jgi:DNA replication and repair protein RecF
MGTYGSRGQQRTVALSLKLAEASHLKDQTQEVPLLLLDDIMSELDQTRRSHLLRVVLSSQQVLITATDLDPFDPSFLDQVTLFRVKEGEVEPA